VDRRLKTGRLVRLHPSVYAVGHTALPELGPAMAAVLATSRWDELARVPVGSAVSHTTAAELLRIRDPARGTLHVVTATRKHPRGVIVHRTAALPPQDVTLVRGVPCTALPRTLIDLGELLEPRWLVRALERAAIRRILDEVALQQALRRHNGRHGVAAVRAALATGHHLDPQTCDSVMEELFLFLMREADPAMPLQPEMQGWVTLSRRERFRVDALFRDLRVAIELDSRWHDPAGPRMRDEARDGALRRDGYLTYRFRYRDVVDRPGWVVYVVRDLIARASGRRAA